MASWSDHAIWWQLHPLTFLGAQQAPPGSRLPGLEPWLDYLVELGCNGLLLGPVFASGTHGYDVTDHYRIDPRLGTEADFDRLVAAAHRRGVRVLLDGVFNHVGRGFGAFADVLEHGRDSRHTDWFRLDFEAGGPDGFGYATFEGHHDLVALNHQSPAVADHVTAVMTHWLGRGADGWRLDAAYAVPTGFWRPVLDRVRAARPDCWLVGEVLHGDYPAWVHDSGADSTTQYELWKALWSGLNDRNFFELAWALDRHNRFAAAFAPQTFVGNHDVTRLASKVDPRHLGHALTVLFTVAGVPSVYAGDEQGFRGTKYERAGGDDEIRPAFPAGPNELAPEGWGLYRLHQNLIGLRRRHPWLVRARTEVFALRNEQLGYRVRGEPATDGPGLVVLLNCGEQPSRFALGSAPGKTLLSSGWSSGGADDPLTVPGYGWAVLEG